MKRELCRYIPPNYTQIDSSEIGNCIIYYTLEADKNNKFYAIGYSGRRNKNDFHHSFSTKERMDKFVAEYILSKISTNQYKEEKKANQKIADANVKCEVGKLFIYSYGYNQTNLDFFQVVEIKGKLVTLHKISSKVKDGSQGMMYDYQAPVKDSFLTKSYDDLIIKKRMKSGYEGGVYFSMPFGILKETTEDTYSYCSWYA